MSGIDWRNGKALDGWEHTVQSITVLLTTTIGSRVMRRSYGANSGRLLGEPMMPATILRWRTGIVTALELWEPRFRVLVAYLDSDLDSAETARLGQLRGLVLEGEYRPRGHLGDPTPEGDFRRIYIGAGLSGFEVTA